MKTEWMKKYLLLIISVFYLGSCRTIQVSSSYVKEPTSIFEYFKVGSKNLPMVSVHRGGGEPVNIPENCLESFEFYAKKMPVTIECDIAMSKDSVLFLMHDSTLTRTTTQAGKTKEVTWDYLKTLKIKDNYGNITSFSIPTLDQTLKWGKGKVLFTLDIKRGTPFEKVIASIQKNKAENYSVIITYNATDAKKVYELNQNLMISVGIFNTEDYERLSALGIPDKNMIAFIGTKEPKAELVDFLHQKGIPTILGVLGNLDKKAEANGNKTYRSFLDLGVDVLSTDRPEAVYEEIRRFKNEK